MKPFTNNKKCIHCSLLYFSNNKYFNLRISIKMALIFNLETARNILIEILKTITSPENSKRIAEAKAASGKEMIKLMQNVFPLMMELQMQVIKNYGFGSGREGLVNFSQMIRELEKEDDEIARLRNQIRNVYLPPTISTSPDVLI